MLQFYYATYESPAGPVRIKASDQSIHEVLFVDTAAGNDLYQPAVLKDCLRQLDEYFNGKRTVFDLPLNPSGTSFQYRVWEALQQIPYAETLSYLELSKRLGDIKAIRAVASANGANPIAVMIPCHRVIGSDGSLTGYAGGLKRKQWLLDHEGKTSGKKLSLF